MKPPPNHLRTHRCLGLHRDQPAGHTLLALRGRGRRHSSIDASGFLLRFLFLSPHRRRRRAPLHRQPVEIHLPPRRRVHLDQVCRLIRHDRDPVAGHRVPSSPVPLQVLHMRRRIDVLQPPGDPKQHQLVVPGEVNDHDLNRRVVHDLLQRPPDGSRRNIALESRPAPAILDKCGRNIVFSLEIKSTQDRAMYTRRGSVISTPNTFPSSVRTMLSNMKE